MILINGKEIKFEKFPNGETKLSERSILNVLQSFRVNSVSFKYEDDSDLIKLMMVKKFLDSNANVAIQLIIYYMPYSRMDRIENQSAFTLKYIADFVNYLKFDKVVVVEPHSDVTPALIDNIKARYINFDLLPKVMEDVGFNRDKDYIMFPDSGASKRYHNMKGIKNVLIGHKHRDFETGKITSFDLVGEYKEDGYKVIIVDDLSSYGGTFVHSAKALREEAFEEVYLLVAHAENSIFKGKLFNHIDKVYTTDSMLTDHIHPDNKRFESQLKVYNMNEILNKKRNTE